MGKRHSFGEVSVLNQIGFEDLVRESRISFDGFSRHELPAASVVDVTIQGEELVDELLGRARPHRLDDLPRAKAEESTTEARSAISKA